MNTSDSTKDGGLLAKYPQQAKRVLIFSGVSLLITLAIVQFPGLGKGLLMIGPVKTLYGSNAGGYDNVGSFVNTISERRSKRDLLGEKCSGVADAICGFGRRCHAGKCIEDYSSPQSVLRDAVNQGPCDSSAALSAVHMYDDRIMALENPKSQGSYFSTISTMKLDTYDLTSISHIRDCFLNRVELENLCVADSFDNTVAHLMNSQLCSEKDYGYNSSWTPCGTKESKCKKRPPHQKIPMQEKCFHTFDNHQDTIQRMKNEIKKYGPFAHDFKVFPELLNYPYKDEKRSDKVEVITYKSATGSFKNDRFDPDSSGKRVEGFTSAVIAGFGHSNEHGAYFLVKFHWGKEFGQSGYVKIAQDILVDRYLAECSNNPSLVYKYKEGESYTNALGFPLLSFGIVETLHDMCGNINNDNRALCNALSQRIVNRPKNYKDFKAVEVLPGNVNYNSKTDTYKTLLSGKDDGSDGGIPYVKLATKCALENLKMSDKHGYQYHLNSIKAADLTIVSGRKYNLFLDVNVVNGQGSFQRSEIVHVNVWLPIGNVSPTYNSLKTTHKFETFSNGWLSSSYRYAILMTKPLMVNGHYGNGLGGTGSTAQSGIIQNQLIPAAVTNCGLQYTVTWFACKMGNFLFGSALMTTVTWTAIVVSSILLMLFWKECTPENLSLAAVKISEYLFGIVFGYLGLGQDDKKKK